MSNLLKMKKRSSSKLDHYEAEARLFEKKLNSLERRLQHCIQSEHASTCMCPWNKEELKPVESPPSLLLIEEQRAANNYRSLGYQAPTQRRCHMPIQEVATSRTVYSSTFFDRRDTASSSNSFSKPNSDIRQITPEVFKTAPALLSFDPASISLGLDTPPEERPKKTPTKCHQTQTEPFDFRTPSPRPAAEEQSVLREIETAAEAPPVFIGNGPPVKSDKPSKVARVLSPPTRDAPQPKPAMKTKPGVKAKFAPSLHKTKIKSSQEATVPSPEEDLFKSSIPRYLVTRAKSASKTPSPPRKIKKPEITPSTWREERERKINEKKNDEQYVDDFESEDEEDKGIHVKKKKSPKKFIFKAKSPPAPKMPEPKKRHYNPSEVKKYISQQRRQRCEEKFKVEEDKKNKEERTKQHLNELQNRTRQILQANVRQCRSSKSVEATHKSKSPLSSFAINNLQLNLHNLKSPSVSSKSSMRESNNRLSDEFIEDFVKMHQPRPARQEILNPLQRMMQQKQTLLMK